VETVLRIRELLALGLTLEAISAIEPCFRQREVPRRCAAATGRIQAEIDGLDRRSAEISRARSRLAALIDNS
jgi:DNA-binding transcriptional MerR regulator